MKSKTLASGTEKKSTVLSVREEEKEISSISRALQMERTKQYLIWSWGKNKYGELSHGGTTNAVIPRGVRGLKGKRIKWISSGAQHSAVVTEEGELFVCGSYLHGKLGIEDLTQVNISIFKPVPGLEGMRVRQVECGDYHTLCLLEDGVVYTWGGTLYKKLGVRGGGKDYRSPAPVMGLKGIKIKQVGCGDFHSIALSIEGQLYSWGGGGNFFNRGQCGQGNNKDMEGPELIRALEQKNIIHFRCGGYHTLALSDDNELYAWGAGLYGECGFGAFSNTNSPRQVLFSSKGSTSDLSEGMPFHASSEPRIKDVSAGGHHSMILTEEGMVYTFGYAAHGQLGLHTTVNQAIPQFVKDFIGTPVQQIAAGWHHSMALSERGDLYVCGHGGTGQLGLGETELVPHFVCVTAMGTKNIKKIFSGGNHSWTLLDPDDPERKNYIPPSPLKGALGLKAEEKTESNGLTLEDYALLNVHKESLKNSNYYLQISYTDLGLCHRFVRISPTERSKDKLRSKLIDIINEMTELEAGLLYHKFQEDPDDLSLPKSNKSYTLCMVCDPSQNDPPLLPLNDRKNTSLKANEEKLLGVITNIREENINSEEGIEGKLSAWVKHLYKLIIPICAEPPTFFELRPLMYKEQFQ